MIRYFSDVGKVSHFWTILSGVLSFNEKAKPQRKINPRAFEMPGFVAAGAQIFEKASEAIDFRQINQ
jgi:hypothetical protein